MSIFSNLPILSLGISLSPSTTITHNLTLKDTLRLKAALDCFAVATIEPAILNSLSECTLRIMGGFATQKGSYISPIGNIGFWPGYDLKKINIENQRLSQFIGTLEPYLSKNAFSIKPVALSETQKIEDDISLRLLAGCKYKLPLSISNHNIIAAKNWIYQIENP
jgi:hypothetical protein